MAQDGPYFKKESVLYCQEQPMPSARVESWALERAGEAGGKNSNLKIGAFWG